MLDRLTKTDQLKLRLFAIKPLITKDIKRKFFEQNKKYNNIEGNTRFNNMLQGATAPEDYIRILEEMVK
jgi:hypothetical protein